MAELVDLPTAFDPSTCMRKGLCPVTKLRDQGPEILESHSLYYELHGRGDKYKVVLIMGLNSSSFGWGPQIRYFGASHEHSVLVFDNRGVGNSGYPRGPYSTSAMAEDLITLLDYVGWTAKHDLHVVGISLGGMIAQELAYRIPGHIASLTLAVTTPGGRPWSNFPPWSGVKFLTRLLLVQEPEDKAPLVMEMLFPKKWLEEKAENDLGGRTNRQVQVEDFLRRAAVTKPQRLLGHISQMVAGLTHRVSDYRLGIIGRSIPKITIVTGDYDHLVPSKHSYRIATCMPQAEFLQWEETGHAIHAQWPTRFNELLERTFKEGAERSKNA